MIPTLPQFGRGRPLVSSLDQFKKPAALERYIWAAKVIKDTGCTRVVDAACGCGYGSWLLAKGGGAKKVLGIDIDSIAIEVAKTYWECAGIAFDCGDLRGPAVVIDQPMDVVVSIETIEHIEEPREFLTKFKEWAPVLIATVPNEMIVPFDPAIYRFHYRHYALGDFFDLLSEFYNRVDIGASPDGKELRAVARVE